LHKQNRIVRKVVGQGNHGPDIPGQAT
jgi:hypothetical protein